MKKYQINTVKLLRAIINLKLSDSEFVTNPEFTKDVDLLSDCPDIKSVDTRYYPRSVSGFLDNAINSDQYSRVLEVLLDWQNNETSVSNVFGYTPKELINLFEGRCGIG